jgi:glycosyltransferase involved in cell wall biosynthesis
MTQRRRVLLLIPHLGGGGAERVTALLACGLSPAKYEVHLGVMTRSAFPSPTFPAAVTVHQLGARRVRTAAIPLLHLVRRLRPEVILSGMAHLNFLVLLLRPLFPAQSRVVVRQNSTVSADLRLGRLPVYTRSLYRLLYPAADRIVCQTPSMAGDLAEQSGISNALIRILPNPIDFAAMRSATAVHRWPGPGPHLLAIGRLSPEKGFDLLLEAFSSLRHKFPAADLTIVGEGSARGLLMGICRELQIQNAVSLPGYVPRPEIYFPGANLFILSSRQEGMPNALLEAAAAGLPIAALPSSKGVVDLLRSKQGVWLAPEISSPALADTLLGALKSLGKGQRFAHPWVEPFGMSRAISGYEDLIDQTILTNSRWTM